MDKKILDFPEAAELANDDYIIFDSESGGGCRILAKKIAPVVVGVEATYTQTQEVTPDTPLNDLKQDLVVNALYRNNRKKTVTDYTLSGTLAVGTSTITVTYSGFTTTFNVEVSSDINYLYNWDFTQSLTDSVQGQVAALYNCSRTSSGVIMNSDSAQLLLLSAYNITGKTVEIDFSELSKQGSEYVAWLFEANSNSNFYNYNSSWTARLNNNNQPKTYSVSQSDFNNITMKLVFTSGHLSITYIDDLQEENSFYEGGTFAPDSNIKLQIGRSAGSYPYAVITGVRIYDNV